MGGDRAEFDEYRCFAIELPSTERAFLTGYDVIPGNAAMVHHVIGMPVDLSATSQDGTRTNAEVIAAKGDPEREGWPCFSGAGPDVGPAPEIMIWAPGQGAVEYPAGMGVRIPSGSAMVVQVHYNLVDPALRGQSDQTTIQLKLTPDVDREVLPLLPDGFLDGDASMTEIPAGQAKATVEWEVPVSVIGNLPLDFDLVGFFPHMHERGTRMWVDFERGAGGEDCVARVPSWDFDWQRIYFYDTPIRFSTADTLKVRCEYDTSADTEPTIPGWGTQNEMCLAGVYIALAP